MQPARKGPTMEPPRHFDYIIVGAGPSAMGLVYGLLEAYLEKQQQEEDQRPPPTIAVVERGSGPPNRNGDNVDNDDDTTTNAPVVSSLRDWYQASHRVVSSNKDDNDDGNDVVQIFPSTITGRVLDLPVGKGLGGTSNVNAGLCEPPLPDDFLKSSRWPEPWKSSLLERSKHLLKILDNNGVLYRHHSRNRFTLPDTHQAKQHASPPNHDDSSTTLEFFPEVTTMTRPTKDSDDFERVNFYNGFLEPFLKRHPKLQKSVHWFRGWEVQRLLIDLIEERPLAPTTTTQQGETTNMGRIYGVECAHVTTPESTPSPTTTTTTTTTTWELHARQRTILCAGAIESPALVLVSMPTLVGIDSIIMSGDDNGRDADWKDTSKERILNGVGRGLQDQALLARVYWSATRTDKDKSNNSLSANGIDALGHLFLSSKQELENEGCFQVAVADEISYNFLPAILAMCLRWQCRNPTWAKLVEFSFGIAQSAASFAIHRTPLGNVLRRYTTTTMLFLMHPRSSGSVKIAVREGFDPTEGPLRRRNVDIVADPGYLNDERDLLALQKAWDALGIKTCGWGWEIFPSVPFSLFKFFDKSNPRRWFRSYGRSFLLPYFHFCGSCFMQPVNMMGGTTNWVVEPSSLRLRGFSGISICDASVFPAMLSNPPALSCAAMGYDLGWLLSKTKTL